MKKYCLATVFVFGVLFQVYAQTRPFIGYDQVAWGASVEDVRNAYNLGNDIVLAPGNTNNTADSNIGILTQENVSESITRRTFFFNKWRTGSYQLYRVTVTYRNNTDANRDTLLGLLQQRYGTRTNYEVQSGQTWTSNYTDFVSTFGNFAPDIEVQLQHRVGRDNVFGTWIDTASINVVYTWKRFRDEYLASRLGL